MFRKLLRALGLVQQPEPAQRLSYEASCKHLCEAGWAEFDPPPPMPERMPRHDEEPSGVSFFRTSVEGDLSGLTLPRTFFGRSEIARASFRGTQLRESNLCWNDFIDVRFDGADLGGADMRASHFERAVFDGADLTSADLRRSTFVRCSFKGAVMKRTALTVRQGAALPLSATQRSNIAWADSEGEGPAGG